MSKKRSVKWWEQYVYTIQEVIDSIELWQDSTIDTDDEEEMKIYKETKAEFIKKMNSIINRCYNNHIFGKGQ